MRRCTSWIGWLITMAAGFTLSACAKPIHVDILASPPSATSKLRVYLQVNLPVSSRNPDNKSDRSYEQEQRSVVENYLAKTGIYEIVSARDKEAVLGSQKPELHALEQNGWALARQIGHALCADYVIIVERGIKISALREMYFASFLVNVESGRNFKVEYADSISRGPGWQQGTWVGFQLDDMMRRSYRDMFRDSKEDLLATAIKKNRVVDATAAPSKEIKQDGTIAQTVPSQSFEVRTANREVVPGAFVPAGNGEQRTDDHAQDELRQTVSRGRSEVSYSAAAIEGKQGLFQPAPGKKGDKLVVYDLDTSEQYKTIALILSEALREEFFLLKQFVLVNREDLGKVLQEMALQQTGLIDEKEAVKTGKGLAASQVVTGNLGMLGSTFVLQAKRIDVETFGVLGLSSENFKQGQEEKILDKMPQLVRRLAGVQ